MGPCLAYPLSPFYLPPRYLVWTSFPSMPLLLALRHPDQQEFWGLQRQCQGEPCVSLGFRTGFMQLLSSPPHPYHFSRPWVGATLLPEQSGKSHNNWENPQAWNSHARASERAGMWEPSLQQGLRGPFEQLPNSLFLFRPSANTI